MPGITFFGLQMPGNEVIYPGGDGDFMEKVIDQLDVTEMREETFDTLLEICSAIPDLIKRMKRGGRNEQERNEVYTLFHQKTREAIKEEQELRKLGQPRERTAYMLQRGLELVDERLSSIYRQVSEGQ